MKRVRARTRSLWLARGFSLRRRDFISRVALSGPSSIVNRVACAGGWLVGWLVGWGRWKEANRIW